MDTTTREQPNATVTWRADLAPGLMIIRVVPDGPLFDFTPGQYCVLGLPPDAPRVAGATDDPPVPEHQRSRMIRRSYSIASGSRQREHLEFYVTLVHSGGLTPRLFAMHVGDRLWLGPKATGLFTLSAVPPSADLWLIATGTGLAPYVSMLRTDLTTRPKDRAAVIVHGARHSWDLGYRAEIESLAQMHRNLRYLPAITRPDEDPSFRGETGRLQDLLAAGRLEALAGVPLAPGRSHVFLCGNPGMIEACLGLLGARGFSEWSKQNPEGTLHLEKYW